MNALPQPIGARVLVRPVEAPDTSDAGLHLVRDYADPDVMGDIVAVGSKMGSPCPQCGHIDAPDVEIGDRVLFPPTSGQIVELDGERLIVVPARDVLAIVEE